MSDGVLIGFARCVHETPGALRIDLGTADEPQLIWVPKSQVHEHSDVNEQHDEGELWITPWMARKLGLD